MAGIGIDIEKISRFKNIGCFERFLELVFSREEIRDLNIAADKYRHAASRFALKEAVIKAAPDKLTYRDIEIHRSGEKPSVTIKSGSARSATIMASISHDPENAVAVAMML